MTSRTVVAVLFLVACSSSKSAQPPKGMVWNDMNGDQRHWYMTNVVMPKAKAVFSEFDPKYKAMDCKTCHGPGVDDGSFEMPNPKIRPLPNSPEAFMALMEKDEEVKRYTPFMGGKVEPMMGELLHMSVFDPQTNSGELSCSNCHTLVDADGKVVPPPPRPGQKPQHTHEH